MSSSSATLEEGHDGRSTTTRSREAAPADCRPKRFTGRTRFVSGRGIAMAILLIGAMSGGLAGCNGSADDSPSSGTRVERTTPETDALVPSAARQTPATRRAYRQGRDACRDASPAVVIEHYLPRARRVARKRELRGLRGLIRRVETLPATSRSAPHARPMAAALYALAISRGERAGAFRGCMAALRSSRGPR
jgi:hypothetical protein